MSRPACPGTPSAVARSIRLGKRGAYLKVLYLLLHVAVLGLVLLELLESLQKESLKVLRSLQVLHPLPCLSHLRFEVLEGLHLLKVPLDLHQVLAAHTLMMLVVVALMLDLLF